MHNGKKTTLSIQNEHISGVAGFPAGFLGPQKKSKSVKQCGV